jgi:putative (di)nucleoside polyphosphate hydrolase
MTSRDYDSISKDDGYRPNVGIILFNRYNQVLWARRRAHDGWQFPQGGVQSNETPEEALFRELYEEIGLTRDHVRVIARTQDWLKYDLPSKLRRRQRSKNENFMGQKQIWFLLRLLCEDSMVCLDTSTKPEFDEWQWIDYWRAVDQIVDFKRHVYVMALTELERFLPNLSFSSRRSR